MADRGPSQHDMSARRESAHSAVVITIDQRLTADEVAAQCERARGSTSDHRPRLIVCDVGLLREPDVATIDALARIALIARQSGCDVQLAGASLFLARLIALVGLAEVLPCRAELPGTSGVEARRQPEEREESGGV